jgi:hypothetical protein
VCRSWVTPFVDYSFSKNKDKVNSKNKFFSLDLSLLNRHIKKMRLEDWLNKENITPYAFSKMLGLKKAGAVYRWVNGENIPQKRYRDKIFNVTKGKVKPSDLITE